RIGSVIQLSCARATRFTGRHQLARRNAYPRQKNGARSNKGAHPHLNAAAQYRAGCDVNVVAGAAVVIDGIYAIVATLFGTDEKSPQAVALGAILVFGVAYLLAQGLADRAPWALTWRTALYSGAAAIGYFALQRGAELLMAGTLPATLAPGPLEWALIVLAMLSFALVAVAQAMFPLCPFHHPHAPRGASRILHPRTLGGLPQSVREPRSAP
ncbi:MAG: hypothetical protein AAGF49_10250, partial [Pseudomonadota bacterium]